MKLGYVIIYVPDVMASIAFYQRAFGLEPRFVHETGQYAEMETGATALAFVNEDFARENVSDFSPNRPHQLPAAIEIAFVIDDVANAVSIAIAAGCQLVKPAQKKPWGQIVAYVRDMNGTLIELCTPVGEAA